MKRLDKLGVLAITLIGHVVFGIACFAFYQSDTAFLLKSGSWCGLTLLGLYFMHRVPNNEVSTRGETIAAFVTAYICAIVPLGLFGLMLFLDAVMSGADLR